MILAINSCWAVRWVGLFLSRSNFSWVWKSLHIIEVVSNTIGRKLKWWSIERHIQWGEILTHLGFYYKDMWYHYFYFNFFLRWSRTIGGNSESFIDNRACSSSQKVSSWSLNHIQYFVIFWYFALNAARKSLFTFVSMVLVSSNSARINILLL